MENVKPRWREVLNISMPLCLSYIPIGLACGILLHAAGFSWILTTLVSLLVFSGGAQFMIASMLVANAPMHTILIMPYLVRVYRNICGGQVKSSSIFLQLR